MRERSRVSSIFQSLVGERHSLFCATLHICFWLLFPAALCQGKGHQCANERCSGCISRAYVARTWGQISAFFQPVFAWWSFTTRKGCLWPEVRGSGYKVAYHWKTNPVNGSRAIFAEWEGE